MLVLRTFDATRRVERLFDAVVERWRFTGSVQLIGAPDLAQRTIDPGDLLLFLAGRFESHFVQSPDDLKRRLQALDVRRDPDGRFRVNDFYCFDSTWQEALVALLLESDVVLMDLRGLSAVNRGCQFELTKLVEHHKLGQTLLVVDDTTDETLLHATLEEAMRDLGESALQQTALQPEVVRLGNGRVRDLDRMFDALVSLNGSNGAGGEHIGG
jgi:hypothetical protein